MDTKSPILLLFALTGTFIVTIWFALGYLNTFLKNVFAIIGCALYVMLSPFVAYVGRVCAALKRNIYHPIQKRIQRIHIPLGIRIVIYLMLGVGILALDYFYNTKIYEADETIFYHAIFQGKTYWITKNGLIIGGFFLGLAVLLFLIEVLTIIDRFISRPISLFITIQK
jgi:hypothetical protein